MSQIQEIYNTFQKGDPLTDEELAVGIRHFTKMEELLRVSGPVFRLAANEAARVGDRLSDYKRERAR